MKNIMKILLNIIITLLALSAFAQQVNSSTEIITKGKKQGLFDTSKSTWVFPMDNQYIYDLGNDFYGIFNPKSKSIEGVFLNKSFTLKSTSNKQLYIQENNDWYEFPIFTMGKWNITNNGTAVKSNPNTYGQNTCSNYGIFQHKNIHLVGVSAHIEGESLAKLNVIANKKGEILNSFENVHWKILNNNLYVSFYKHFQEHSQEYSEYAINKIEIYALQENGVSLTKTLQNDTSDYFYKLAVWTNSSHSDFHPEIEQYVEEKSARYSKLKETDFMKDSSEKYSLIQDLGVMVVFANSSGTWITSAQESWLKISNHSEYTEFTIEPFSLRGVALQDDILLINNSTFYESLHRFDPDYGEPMYDEFGEPVYDDYIGTNASGAWSLSSQKWIINPEFYFLHFVNDKIVINDIEYTTEENSNIMLGHAQVQNLYDLKGTFILKTKSEDALTFYQKVFDADSLTLTDTINNYVYFHRNSKSNLMDLNYFTPENGPEIIATFDDNIISGTFNFSNNSFLSYHNNQIYFNTNLPELGFYKMKIDSKYFGFTNFDEMTWSSNWVSSNQPPKNKITSGIENIGNYTIIRNVSETQILDLEYIDEDGYNVYNEFGDQVLMQEITKGHYNTGLWDNQLKKWALQPIYEDIIVTKNGFTSQHRTDHYTAWVGELGYHRTRLDSITRRYNCYDKSFKITKQFNNQNNPYSDKDLYQYLAPLQPIQKIVQQPIRLDTILYLSIGDYHWAQQQNGKYTMYRLNEIYEDIKIIVEDVDWLHEANNILYYISNDSLYIHHLQNESNEGLVFPMSKFNDFQIMDTDGYFGLDHIHYELSSDYTFKELGAGAHSFQYLKTSIYFTKNQIIITGSQKEFYEFYGDWDDFYTVSCKVNRDVVWIKDGNNWEYKMDAASISEAPFGFAASNNFGYVQSDYERTSLLSGEFNGLYTKDFKKIDLPDFRDFFRQERVDNFYLITYICTDESVKIVLMNLDNKIEKVFEGYNSYDLKENEIIFYNYDEFGTPEYDEYGDPIEFKYTFK